MASLATDVLEQALRNSSESETYAIRKLLVGLLNIETDVFDDFQAVRELPELRQAVTWEALLRVAPWRLDRSWYKDANFRSPFLHPNITEPSTLLLGSDEQYEAHTLIASAMEIENDPIWLSTERVRESISYLRRPADKRDSQRRDEILRKLEHLSRVLLIGEGSPTAEDPLSLDILKYAIDGVKQPSEPLIQSTHYFQADFVQLLWFALIRMPDFHEAGSLISKLNSYLQERNFGNFVLRVNLYIARYIVGTTRSNWVRRTTFCMPIARFMRYFS